MDESQEVGAVADTLEQALEQLGEPRAEFNPDPARLIVGIVFGVLFVLAGVGLAVLILRSDANPTWSLAGLVLVLLGVGLILLVRRMSSLRVFICSEGLVIARGDRAEACPWGQIKEVLELVIEDHLPLKGVAKHAVPMGTSHTYCFLLRSGKRHGFNRDDLAKLGTFARMLREETDRRDIPWRVGTPNDFENEF